MIDFKRDTFGIFFLLFILFFSKNGFSQSGISGKVTDQETGEEMIAANVVMLQNGVFIDGETTDIDGNYFLQVDSGQYDIEVSYTGYPIHKVTGIIVNNKQITKVDLQIGISPKKRMEEIIFTSICIPIIQQDKTSSGETISFGKIKNLPTRDIYEMSTLAPGVSFNN